jgi:hypothetical protein
MESNARLLLHKAHSATCSIGAATAIVAILDRSGTLHVANVGDCGLRILRNGKVVFATSPQQHYFDCPYQFSSSEGGQSASDAAVFKAELLKGDTIVLGSDGLFDNVYDRDIESTLSVFGGSDQESAERSGTVLPIPTTGLSVHVQASFLLCQIEVCWKILTPLHMPDWFVRALMWSSLQQWHWLYWQTNTPGTRHMNHHIAEKPFSRVWIYHGGKRFWEKS